MRKQALADKKVLPNSKVIKRVKGKVHPGNESYEHYFCKMVAQLILYRKFKCKAIGVEVMGMHHHDIIKDDSGRLCKPKSIIDAVGVSGRWAGQKQDYKVYGIEAKVTKADYRNGFSAKCPYTYIICPKGIVPLDIIPKGIGLIYVDIPNFAYIRSDESFHGIEIIKRATKRVDCSISKDIDYINFVDRTIDGITRVNAIRNAFNPRIIPLYEYE